MKNLLVIFSLSLVTVPSYAARQVTNRPSTGWNQPAPRTIIRYVKGDTQYLTPPGFNMSVDDVVDKLKDAAGDVKQRIKKDFEDYIDYLHDFVDDSSQDRPCYRGYCRSNLLNQGSLEDLLRQLERLENDYRNVADDLKQEAKDLAGKIKDGKNLRNAKNNLEDALDDLYDLIDDAETAVPLGSRTIAAVGALEFLVDELPQDLDN